MNDEFAHCIDYVDSRYYFTHGGCLEFAKVLNHYLIGSKIVISKDFEHFAVWFNGDIYDAYGIVSDKDSFFSVTYEELSLIEYKYGLGLKFNGQFVDMAIINEVNNCSGDYVGKLLQKINKGN